MDGALLGRPFVIIVLLVDEGTGQGLLTSGSRALFRYSGAFFMAYRSRPGDHARRTNVFVICSDASKDRPKVGASFFWFLVFFHACQERR